ncbi:type IV pilus biogenesis/stability protein PilW [Pasteurellaceae bacterium Pebbles2]|nr:type IV pilus biogenesis/stability protein PilW [Pasteurellaceae bacterium Pebbles2]
MKFKPHFWLIFLLAGCVSQPSQVDFDRKQAAKARIELAFGYLAQQNQVQAKQNLDKALEHAPNYYLVYSALAYFYQQQGDQAQARQAYLKALDLDRQQGDVYNNYGVFLCSQGEFEAAYQQFDLALASPNYYHQADSYENKALCALSQNNPEIYQQSQQALAKIDPVRAQKLSQH